MGRQPKRWVQWLPWVECCFSTSHHISSRFTNFELVYGYSPPYIAPYEMGNARVDYLEQTLVKMDGILAVLKYYLELAQNKMKLQANKKRIEKYFAVGDIVDLRLVPNQLQSLASHSYQKL